MGTILTLDSGFVREGLELIKYYKTSSIGLGRWILHLNLKLVERLFGLWWKIMDNNGKFAVQAIWFSILALGVTIMSVYIYPKWRAYVTARHCKIKIDWNKTNEESPNEVGAEAVMVKISPFLSPTTTPTVGFPEAETGHDLVSDMDVRVFLNADEIDVRRDTEDLCIKLYFLVKQAGKYSLFVWYKGYALPNSPFSVTMDPAALDMSKSFVDVCNPVIIVQHRQFRLDLIPIDTFGNRCATTLDHMRRIKFSAIEKKPPCPKAGIPEPKDESTLSTNEQHPDFRIGFGMRREEPDNPAVEPIYTIYGKCKGVGPYTAAVSVNGVPVRLSCPTKEVHIRFLSITEEEADTLSHLQSQGHSTFPAHLVPKGLNEGDGSPAKDTNTEVSIELTPKFLYVTSSLYDVGPMRTRLFTCRVGEHTKVEIEHLGENEDFFGIRITDNFGEQYPAPDHSLTLPQIGTRLLLSLYQSFCKATVKNSGPFPRKLSHETLLHVKLCNFERKKVFLFNTLTEYYNKFDVPRDQYKILKLKRSKLPETVLSETQEFTCVDWANTFMISFQNEPVKGDTWSWLECLGQILTEMLESSAFGMFLGKNLTSGGRNRRGLIHPNPNRHPRWTLEYYELAGKIIGKYILETALDKSGESRQFLVDARFSRSFLAMILGVMPTYKHLQLDDPNEFASTLEDVLNTSNVEELNLKFVAHVYDEVGNLKVHPLVPDGTEVGVTRENKLEYLNALSAFHMTKNVEKELEAFVSGLTLLIPLNSLMLFDENELELLICGTSKLNLRELKMYHETGQYNLRGEMIKDWLWAALSSLHDEDLGRFLQFLTGSSRIPTDGFVALTPSISFSGLFGQLPTANKATCHLTLTDHTDYHEFLSALLTAIRKDSFSQ